MEIVEYIKRFLGRLTVRQYWQAIDWIYNFAALENAKRPPFTEIPDGLGRARNA